MHRFALRGAGLLAAAIVAAGAGSTAAAHEPPSAHASCSYARIAGQQKCIARGQFCQHTARANRDYHRHGLHCGKADRNGRYHLVSW